MCVCVWWNQVTKNKKTGLTSVFENIKLSYYSLKILKIELTFFYISLITIYFRAAINSYHLLWKRFSYTLEVTDIVGRRQSCLLPMCSLLWIFMSVMLLVPCIVQLSGTGKYRGASPLHWAALYSIEKASYSCDFYCEQRSLRLGNTRTCTIPICQDHWMKILVKHYRL